MKPSLEQGRRAKDPLASLVKDVRVEKDQMVLELPREDATPVEVELNMALSPQQNASVFYEHRARLQAKEAKTQQAAEQALKKAQASAAAEIKAQKIAQKKKATAASRKPMWFEKFYWFLSSENFLVISARDAQQNEVLIKKYLRPKDLVFHAQIQGAAFTVVRNDSSEPVPLTTLNEAALAALAHSRAWDLKVAVEVYFVEANQVSKSAPSGLYLPTGSFMIYGKKNFLSPSKLEMGFGLLWRVDEESAKRHAGERSVRQLEPQVPKQSAPPAPEAQPHPKPTEEAELVDTMVQADKKATQKGNQKKKVEPTPNEENEVETDSKPEKVLPLRGKEKKKEKARTKPKAKDKAKEKADPKAQTVSKKEEQPAEKAPSVKSQKSKKREQEKLKKYAEKYAEETPAETELRMKMLGYQKSAQFDKAKESVMLKKPVAQPEKAEPEQPAKPKIESGEDKSAAQPSKSAPAKEASAEEKPKTPKPTKKARESAEALQQELEGEQEAEELQQGVEDYSALTGLPIAEDVVYDAVPVCAPYATLTNYKFKLKLQPGNLKKGKIVKSAMDLYLRQPDATERERDLLKILPDTVSVMQALGNSKILTAGYLKLKASSKQAKKK